MQRKDLVSCALALVTLLPAAAGCASQERFGLGSMSLVGAGVINDPENRSLRFDMLKFGLDSFCDEMKSRGLPLRMSSDEEPVMGRFFATACNTQVIDEDTRKSFVVQYSGMGYVTSPQGGRVGFTTTGLSEYAADFVLHEGVLYVYFKPRVVDATGFQTLLVESQLAASAMRLFGVDANGFGRKVVEGQLRRGFTVLRHGSSGETEFGLGLLATSERPFHPFTVETHDKRVLMNERTEVHLGQQDFIGPLLVKGDDQSLYLTVAVDGAPAVDVLLVSETAGRAMLETFTRQAGPAALVGAGLLDEPAARGSLWKRYLNVPAGNYFLVLDNSAAAGRTTPPAGPSDGLSARVDVLILTGDRP